MWGPLAEPRDVQVPEIAICALLGLQEASLVQLPDHMPNVSPHSLQMRRIDGRAVVTELL